MALSGTEDRPPANPWRFRWRRILGGLLLCWLIAGAWVWTRPSRRIELVPLGWLTATNGTPVLRLRLTNGTPHARFVVDTVDHRLHVGLLSESRHWGGPALIANSLTLAVPAGGWLDVDVAVDVPFVEPRSPVRAQCIIRERLPEGWLRVVSMLPGTTTKGWLLQGLNRVYRPEFIWTDWISAPTNGWPRGAPGATGP